jgi:predicted MFS family arabinose efflux permease
LTRAPDPRQVAVAGLCALAIAMGFGRFAYTPLLPWMQAEVRFGPEVAGFLASANLVGYLAGALAVAAMPAAWPRLAPFRFCLLASIVTTAAMGLTTSIPVWAALRLVGGFASAGVLVIGSDLVAGTLRATGRPGLLGLHFSGVGTGVAISGLVAVLPPELAWRTGWLLLGGLSLALLPLCWGWLGTPPTAAAGSAAPPQAERYPIAPLLVAYLCEGAGYIVTGTFLVALLAGQPDLQLDRAVFWIAVGLAAAPSTVLCSLLARRFGGVPTLIAAHLVQAVGIALPAVSQGLASALLSAVLFGATFMGITALTLTVGAANAGPNRARIIGLLTAAFGLGQAVGPTAAGMIAARTGSFDLALVAAAAVVTLGAAILAAGRMYAATARVQSSV